MEKSRKERRKKFSKWIDMDMYHKNRPKPISGTGEGKSVKVMSNEDRRRLGLPEDPDLTK